MRKYFAFLASFQFERAIKFEGDMFHANSVVTKNSLCYESTRCI